jgi:hypothetical protein
MVSSSKCSNVFFSVLRIRIRRIHMYFGVLDPDPDPRVGDMEPDPNPIIIKLKLQEKP